MLDTKQSQESVPTQELGLFDMDEVVVGKRLGSGGFCSVYSVSKFRLTRTPPNANAELTESQIETRRIMAKNTRDHRSKTDSSTYAVKFLRTGMKHKRPNLFQLAKRDMETECAILKQLNHPNIIKIRGCGISLGENGECNQHFLILDRLDSTLVQRLEQWKTHGKRQERLNHPVIGILDKRGLKRKRFLIERLQVASEIASALEYLHANRIIYRDLKPSNIGFSKTGQMKLIDFGIARKVPDGTDVNDTFNMTGRIGTFRYWAPEVSMKQPYNELADVYSFAIVLQNILKLQTPYEAYNKATHFVMVAQDGERPPIDCEWPEGVQELLKKCWSPNIKERPSMTEVVVVLKQVTTMLVRGKVTALQHVTTMLSRSKVAFM